MRSWIALAMLLFLSAVAQAQAPALPRGIGFRVAGQADTPEHVREDFGFIRQAIDDTDFEASLKGKLAKLVDGGSEELKAAKTPADAARVRDRIDHEAGELLSAGHRDELLRRTRIVCVELLLLNSGLSADAIDDKVVAALRLTPDQASRIRGVLYKLQPDGAEGEQVTGRPTATAARREIRALLTPDQRKLLDAKIEAGIKAAAAESGATTKKAPPDPP
jgi:hypothetical protein